MATSSIAPTSSLTSSSAASNNTGSLGLTQADFMKLLTAQMQYQDPSNPLSGADLVTQLSQFSSVQGVQQLNTSITQMLMLQQVTQAANLIGKQITFASTGKSLSTSGTVSSVQINNGQVQLMVGSQAVALSQILSVANSGSSK